MKILFYTDLHIKESSTYIGFNTILCNGLTKELNNFLIGIKFVRDKILELKPDLVVNLGDTVNVIDRLSIKELATVSYLSIIYDACKKLSIPHIILQGNHDIYSFNSVEYSFDIEKERGSETVPLTSESFLSPLCDKYISDIEEYSYQGLKFSLIPYLPFSKELLSEYVDNKSDIILTHNEFKGSVYENGVKSPTSLVVTKNVPVFCGHIHKPQKVGNVQYIGSLISVRFDRNPGIRGIGFYDTETKEYSLIENTYSLHYIKCTSVEEALHLNPDKYLIKLQTKEEKEYVEKKLEGYNYLYVREIDKKDSISTHYNIEKSKDPRTILKEYLMENCPDSVDIFEEILENDEFGDE